MSDPTLYIEALYEQAEIESDIALDNEMNLEEAQAFDDEGEVLV